MLGKSNLKGKIIIQLSDELDDKSGDVLLNLGLSGYRPFINIGNRNYF
jgi:hypothetical protein